MYKDDYCLSAAIRQAAQRTTALETALDYGKYTTGPCLIRVGGNTIGEVRTDGVFQKHIKFSAHLYRKLHAVCFDLDALSQAEAAGARWVEVHDDETGRVYHITLAALLAQGIPLNHISPQLALPLAAWYHGSVAEPEARQLPLLEVP